jgi:hypothetical protein
MNIKSFFAVVSFLISMVMTQRTRGREHTSNDYVNLQINRTVDLSASIIQIRSEILIKSLKVDPIYSYRVPILRNASRYLVNFSAKLRSAAQEDEVISLKVVKQIYQSDSPFEFYEVNFKSEPMNYEEERVLILTEDYFGRLEMLPKKISIKEDQLVVFEDTINHVSFYQTLAQRVKVILPRERTEIM